MQVPLLNKREGGHMRRTNFLATGLFLGVLFSIPTSVCGQTASDPKLQDYTNWEKIGPATAPFILDGKDVELKGEFYRYTDWPNLKRYNLELVYKEDGSPWLAFQTEKTGERQPDGSVITKETHTYMFENVNGKWVFIRDLSKIQDPNEFSKFMRERYKLEFK
ncbi:MAG: hypothetical protein Q8R55_00840 [Candidatus Taylorbacteria bacterium]|nr:hypothetical protein [Candidatus Taylorbacteria bacterium]